MKLNIDENKFLAAVDTEGDPEVGVGMADIVERLRKWSVFGYGYEASCDMKEAATAIELQRISVAHAAKLLSERTAEIERLRAALRDMLRLVEDDEDDPAPYLIDVVCDRARAALDGQSGEETHE